MDDPQASDPQASDANERERLAWEAIVAQLAGELPGGPEPREPGPPAGSAQAPTSPGIPRADTEHNPDPDDVFIDALLAEDEGGYQPPDPGPFPVPADVISRFAWAGAIGGPVLVLLGYVLDLGTLVSGIGIAAFVGGFATLVVRLPDRERDEDDDGAVI